MTEPTPLQLLGSETRPMFDRFWSIIAPVQHDLWRYCRKLAGNPWDGEDLYQDTIMKTFTSLSSLSIRSQILQPKAFLFRVATNHWIDTCRKQRRHIGEASSEEPAAEPQSEFVVYETIEHLLQYLSPKQTAAVVLADAFQFTAQEAAEIMGTTEGAVHAALFRGRSNLRKLQKETPQTAPLYSPDVAILQQYVEYFNKRDFEGIAGLLAEHAVFSFVTQSSKEFGRDTIMKASHQPSHYERSELHAVLQELWNRPAVIFYIVSEAGIPIALNEVLDIETEDEHIIGIKGYHFCPEFMESAAGELGVPREKWSWGGGSD